MLCAIHQPNFFPWLGYFDKINRSDKFVFLDNVDYSNSSSWTNRVAINVKGNKKWINCPVKHGRGIQKIMDVEICDDFNWQSKLIKTLKYNYAKTDYYKKVMPFVEEWVNASVDKIADYNIFIIKEICNMLGLKKEFIRQKDLNTTKHSTELMIEITGLVGCDTYLCGGGADGYQKDELFEKNGLVLEYQNFKAPKYYQVGNEYIEGLSIIDALFNIGFEGVQELLHN